MEKKYIPLAAFFQSSTQDSITLSFSALENIMGQSLPNAAYLNSSWWKKTKPPLTHYLSWTESNFYVQEVKLGTQVTFSKPDAEITNTDLDETMKNTYIIRTIEAEDARSFINLQELTFQQSPFMHYGESEKEVTVQQIRKNLVQWKKDNNRTILLCILNGEFAGYAVIQGFKSSRTKHVASIRLAIKNEFQRLGLGISLLQSAEKWCADHGITRVELTVMKHNEAALALFKKSNYQIDGVRQNAIQLDNLFYDEYYMSKIL